VRNITCNNCSPELVVGWVGHQKRCTLACPAHMSTVVRYFKGVMHSLMQSHALTVASTAHKQGVHPGSPWMAQVACLLYLLYLQHFQHTALNTLGQTLSSCRSCQYSTSTVVQFAQACVHFFVSWQKAYMPC
jgi:hypothetical protein